MDPWRQAASASRLPPQSLAPHTPYSTYSFPFTVAFTCTPSLLSFKPPSRPSTPISTRRIRSRYADSEFCRRCLTSTISPSLNAALDLPGALRKDRSACPTRRLISHPSLALPPLHPSRYLDPPSPTSCGKHHRHDGLAGERRWLRKPQKAPESKWRQRRRWARRPRQFHRPETETTGLYDLQETQAQVRWHEAEL